LANAKFIDCSDLRYSYDFVLPVGEKLIATRGGQVLDLVESFSTTSNGSEETNYVVIRHDDGSISVYLHLSQDRVLVKVGERVSQGQPIAVSGNSGYTAGFAHLHYHVLTPLFNQCGNGIFLGGKAIPITFKMPTHRVRHY
jgi:murein DD-endopeptidase MepM/ murein hydrolase activator NlpD